MDDAFTLPALSCTDVDLGDNHEHSSAGPCAIGFRAVLKWMDNRNKKQSLSVPSIWVKLIEGH